MAIRAEEGEAVSDLRQRGGGAAIESAAAMPLDDTAVGKEWGPVDFEVEADRIAQYADAVGDGGQIHRDSEAAKAAGFRDVAAPPMFCVVYSGAALGPAVTDPEVGMNLGAMVHGGQRFEWGEPVCAGDTITTTARCVEISERDGKGFYVFESVSTNQDGAETVRGTWTDIVRGV
ncbi:MAG: MaoC family dehydratase N-terminal domain-containing protein [Actinomycetota bacterium]